MIPQTHQAISHELCGHPETLSPGRASVSLQTSPTMAVDARGLVHGGFVFGLADHAAMLAVNHPNVVLGSAQVKFTRPVVAGDALRAEAHVSELAGRKHTVAVEVSRGGEIVFTGTFECFVRERHVLEPWPG